MTEKGEYPPDEEKATMGASVDLERDVEKSSSEPLMAEANAQPQEGAKRGRGRMATVIDLGCILLNILSTVLLVFVNKWYLPYPVRWTKWPDIVGRIFNDAQLKDTQISYAMWHFACTSIVLWLATRRPFKLFVPVRLPFLQMLPLCSFFAGFLILGNLSLAYNSVGFYQ
jgi:hypothetical protein